MFQLPVRVYHEDTDAGGIVYYANYLRFMERARTEYLRELGFEQPQLMAEQKRMFVVTHCEIDYRTPARFNDKLLVSAEPVECRRASMEFRQRVFVDDSSVLTDVTQEGGPNATSNAISGQAAFGSNESSLVCEATIRLACLDSETMRPAAMPLELTKVFKLALSWP